MSRVHVMTRRSLKDQVVDTALRLAERKSWEAVRLHDIAAELGAELDDIRGHFREKEDIVDAWFDRADSAMLRDAANPEFLALAARERLHRAIMTWLSALAPHRRPTRQMIANKLEPGHIHFQFSGLLRVSRTVQWIREAAQRDAVLPRRALEEAVLTSIYLLTFGRWMYDDSPNASNTSAFLNGLLTRAQTLARAVPGYRVDRTASPRPDERARPRSSMGDPR